MRVHDVNLLDAKVHLLQAHEHALAAAEGLKHLAGRYVRMTADTCLAGLRLKTLADELPVPDLRGTGAEADPTADQLLEQAIALASRRGGIRSPGELEADLGELSTLVKRLHYVLSEGYSLPRAWLSRR